MTVDPVVAAAAITAVVGLQAWTLKELVGVKITLARLSETLRRLPCEQRRRAECPSETNEP
jgi:hypothetical protein